MRTVEESEQAFLGQIDASLGFLILLVLGVLLSVLVLWEQRRTVCLALEGEEEQAAELAAPILRLRRAASALVVGSLGFFFLLSQESARRAAAGTDPAACRSAVRNLWASLLVFAAALIRLYDLSATEREGQTGAAEDALPA